MSILRDINEKDKPEMPDRSAQISMIEKLRKKCTAKLKSGERMEAEGVTLITAKQYKEVKHADDVTSALF